MATRIKGITVKIGGDVTDLEKALQKTNKEIGSTQSQLKDVERLLKLDPNNATLLAQKQKLLAQAAGETREKLKKLNEANDQAAKSVKNYDKWKAAYDPIQSQIDATRKKLKELRDQQQALSDAGEVDTDAYRALAEEAKQTSKELSALNKQAKAVSEEFGNPISQKQYDALQREIAATEIGLRDLEGQAEDVAAKIRKIDEKPIEDVENAAKQAADALGDAERNAADFSDVLKANLISEAASGIVSSLREVAEETKEYRRIMASLEQSSASAGYTAEETSEAYLKLYGILSDEQSAATTLANLQALGLNQSELLSLIDGVVGAWAKYGDSIPIDGLAEAMNHTIKLGEVQGNLADVLEWAGVSTDAFNRRLAYCSTQEERVKAISAQFAYQGLPAMGRAWQDTNASLVESNEANARMQMQLAELGALVEPVFTRVVNAVAAALEWFNGLDSETQNFIFTAVGVVVGLGAVIAVISGVCDAVSGAMNLFDTMTTVVLPGVQTAFTSVFGFIAANPIVLIIGAILAVVAAVAVFGDEIQTVLQKVDDFLQGVFAKDWTEVFGPVLGGALNGFFSFAKGIWDGLKQILDGVIDFIRGVFTGDWERAWSGVVGIFSGLFSGLVTIALVPINGLIGMINDFIDCLNLAISGANALLGLNIGQIGHIPELNAGMITGSGNPSAGTGEFSGGSGGGGRPGAAAIPFMASGGELFSGSAIVGEAGAELLTVANGRAIVQPLSSSTSNATYMGGVNITVYGAPGQDERALVDIMMDEMQARVERTEVALA